MSSMPSPAPLRAQFGRAAALALCLAVGCDDAGRFTTAPGEAYCGSITLGSPFRAGLSPRVQMRLRLDASALDGADSPGELSTYEAPDGEQPERRLFTAAALRPIEAMAHDSLSRLEFGEGRERNAIYAVSPDDPAAESMLAVISLKADGGAEVRLVRGGAPETDSAPAAGRRTVFGIFPLSREKGDCGF